MKSKKAISYSLEKIDIFLNLSYGGGGGGMKKFKEIITI